MRMRSGWLVADNITVCYIWFVQFGRCIVARFARLSGTRRVVLVVVALFAAAILLSGSDMPLLGMRRAAIVALVKQTFL